MGRLSRFIHFFTENTRGRKPPVSEDWYTIYGPVVSFTTQSPAPVQSLNVSIDPVQSGSGDPAPDNVRPIAGHTQAKIWVKAFHDTSATPTVTVDLNGTIYGGKLNVLTGALTVTHKKVVLPTSFNSWAISGNGRYATLAVLGLTDIKPGNPTTLRTSFCKMNALKPSELGWAGAASSSSPQFVVSTDGYLLLNIGVTAPTVSQINQFISDTGLYIVYPLATPVTYQLTAQEVSTLLGENNIWADTGDVNLEYRVDINSCCLSKQIKNALLLCFRHVVFTDNDENYYQTLYDSLFPPIYIESTFYTYSVETGGTLGRYALFYTGDRGYSGFWAKVKKNTDYIVTITGKHFNRFRIQGNNTFNPNNIQYTNDSSLYPLDQLFASAQNPENTSIEQTVSTTVNSGAYEWLSIPVRSGITSDGTDAYAISCTIREV